MWCEEGKVVLVLGPLAQGRELKVDTSGHSGVPHFLVGGGVEVLPCQVVEGEDPGESGDDSSSSPGGVEDGRELGGSEPLFEDRGCPVGMT